MSRHSLRVRLLMLLCLLLACPSTFAQTITEQESAAIDRAVQEQIREQGLVGVAVGVIRDSKIVYTRGYGRAKLFPPVPVTEQSIFNWASNSKPVMAVVAMQLVQEGRLDLDRSITEYLPELPDTWQPVTARHLLCHQSGIPHYTNGQVIPSQESQTVDDELDPLKSCHRFDRSPLIFEPGNKMAYSSHAYVLLSAVVQQAGGKPVDVLLSERITQPLNMTSFQLDVPFEDQPHWVTAYRKVLGKPVAVSDTAHFWKHGAGGYKSNVQDFARFALALSSGELINAETTEAMWTRQALRAGDETNYGLGVVVEGTGPSLKISHNGSQDETRTRMVLYPRQRHGVVVMCNTAAAEPGRISTAIYQALQD